MRSSLRIIPPIALLAAAALSADEGMWTFDNPPTKLIQQKYNFTLTQQWLDHVRFSSARLNDGGSGSFVSAHGLLLTNHHVARGQLQKSSTPEHDYIKNGFYASDYSQEMKAPDLEVNVLMSFENVTTRVQAAAKGAASPEAQFQAKQKIIADIERESLEKTKLRSDVVTLYQGGEYWLYRYKKYTDARIVFAPEQQAAFFGGDPDNFTYPRYDLDMALFRIYENGKPIDTPNYLKWNSKGAADGELVFVSGHPGSTSRLDTMAQLEFERDVVLPIQLRLLNDRLQVLRRFSASSEEHARQASSRIFGLENSLKAFKGELQGLQDKHTMDTKSADEERFQTAVNNKAELKAKFGNAWKEIAEATRKSQTRIKEQFFHSMDSELGTKAVQIVQWVAEVKKPDGDRLPGYHDAQLESMKFEMLSPAPVYRDLEIARMTGALELDLKELGPNEPFLKALLGGKTPAAFAKEMIGGTKLDDPKVRKALLDGGEAAVNASTDPLIVIARRVDPMRREQIKWFQTNVESIEERAGEQLGQARFAVYGKNAYPDATFTLRLSYGTVKGYPMNGTIAPPITTFYGLYDRAASFGGKGDFELMPRWQKGKTTLDLATPFNFVTTNDIIGGNSGSPVINKAGEIVGLVFDGNIESLVGDYVFDIETNRTVAVHTAGMTEALKKLYNADRLLSEVLGK